MGKLDTIDEGLDTVDSILTKVGNMFKKHWGKIIVLSLCLFVYWAWNLPDEDLEDYDTEITDEHFHIENGDTIWYEDFNEH